MLWPFNHFRKSGAPLRGTIVTIYGMIVAQAREPAFYQAFGVPDTVNGRFDMVVLHLWMVMRRLRDGGDASGLAQGLIDHFTSDMDDNLRELGVGDLTVPKRILKYGEAFYGRARAYDTALAADAGASVAGAASSLVMALSKNIYNGQGLASHEAPRLATYVSTARSELDGMAEPQLITGNWRFPAPTP